MHPNRFRALTAAFVAVVAVALAGVLTAAALPAGDPSSIAVGAAGPSTTTTVGTAGGSTPPVDAEQVIGHAVRTRTYLEELEAQRRAEEAAALEALARAQEEEAALRTLAEAAAAAERAEAEAAKALERPAGVPDDSYWDRMAQCETGGNWSMVGSRYSGGLGFYNGTWDAWGGREFADNAGRATRDQQIVVANRIATQGYHGPNGFVRPVGYSGWGCVSSVGYP